MKSHCSRSRIPFSHTLCIAGKPHTIQAMLRCHRLNIYVIRLLQTHRCRLTLTLNKLRTSTFLTIPLLRRNLFFIFAVRNSVLRSSCVIPLAAFSGSYSVCRIVGDTVFLFKGSKQPILFLTIPC